MVMAPPFLVEPASMRAAPPTRPSDATSDRYRPPMASQAQHCADFVAGLYDSGRLRGSSRIAQPEVRQRGAFSASLAPNTGAQPAGVYYKLVCQLGGQQPSTEYGVVPIHRID